MSHEPTSEQKKVFGENVKLDAKGDPIEMGLGAPANPNVPHFQAVAKAAENATRKFPSEENKSAEKVAKAELVKQTGKFQAKAKVEKQDDF